MKRWCMNYLQICLDFAWVLHQYSFIINKIWNFLHVVVAVSSFSCLKHVFNKEHTIRIITETKNMRAEDENDSFNQFFFNLHKQSKYEEYMMGESMDIRQCVCGAMRGFRWFFMDYQSHEERRGTLRAVRTLSAHMHRYLWIFLEIYWSTMDHQWICPLCIIYNTGGRLKTSVHPRSNGGVFFPPVAFYC